MMHLGSLIHPTQKFVLFRDHIGLERNAQEIIFNVLKSQNEPNIITDIIPETELTLSMEKQVVPFLILPTDKSVIILPPAARLFQQYFASDLFKTIHKLKSSPQVKQVFLWLCIPNFAEHDHLPEFVEHLADVVLRLQTRTEMELLIRKATGSVTKKQYKYEIKDHFMVTEVKKQKEAMVEEAPRVKPESLGTFKIELSEKDRIARNNLVLPFEKHLKIEASSPAAVPPSTGGKIIYDLDKDDDFDEEDPDDDLDI